VNRLAKFDIGLVEVVNSDTNAPGVIEDLVPIASPKDGSGVIMKSVHQSVFWICIACAVVGCRHASVQDKNDWPNPGPVDISSLPPIQNVINHGTTDPDAMLAQRGSQQTLAVGKPGEISDSPQPGRQNVSPIMLGDLSQQADSNSSQIPQSPVKLNESQVQQPPQIQTEAPPVIAQMQPPPVLNQQALLESPPVLPEHPPQTGSALPSKSSVDLQAQKTSTVDANQSIPGQQPPSSPDVRSASSANQMQVIDFEGLSPTAVSAGRIAAHVGSEIITVYDLNVAIQDWIKANVPTGQSIPEKDRLMVARMVLSQMIDRMLIIQEAHRMMKSEKQKEALLSQIDRIWNDQQLPPMMKKYKVDTAYELDQLLRKQGRSLDKAKKDFTNDAIAHEFMGMKLGGKTFVSLVEMRRYYNEHLSEFDQPARYTWREIRIPIEKGDKSAAQAEAQKILKELQQHSDFATLAQRNSKGPTADQGGLWETSPGGFALNEVNSTLDALKPGQMAGPVESAQSIHFIKMEAKRLAGPARFDEVQTQIQERLRNEKLAKVSSGFILELRRQTVVQTIFDDANLNNSAVAGPGTGSARDTNVNRTSSGNTTTVPGPASVSATPQSDSPGVTSPQGLPSQSQSGFSAPGSPIPEPPAVLAPAGPLPTRGMMRGPSQPSPL
jgi:parvulin-like peptidyl-prolyl isomerase